MRKIVVLAGGVLLLVFAATPVMAQRPFGVYGGGPRVGITMNPDQVHFGGHLDMGDLAPRLMLMPSLEVGIGDNMTIVSTTFDVNYRFREDWGSWNPYLGGGIGPQFISSDFGRDNTEVGVAIQGGIARQLTSQPGFMFLEFKLGLVDYPDAKFTVGWNFR